MPVESRKAQLEAMQSSKQSDSERDFERDSAGNAKALSNPTTLARAAAPSANAGTFGYCTQTPLLGQWNGSRFMAQYAVCLESHG